MNYELIIKIQDILKLYMALTKHGDTTEFDECLEELKNKLEIALLNSVAIRLKEINK